LPEERITIDIDDEGRITAKTSGFYGTACMDALMELLDKDDVPMVIKPTDDYYQNTKNTVNNIIRQKGGKL
jgi:hypothetical protein